MSISSDLAKWVYIPSIYRLFKLDILTIYSLEMAKKLNDISEKTGITANIHIKIDTGMSRIGF